MARTGRRFPAKPIVLGALQLAAATGAAPAVANPPQTTHVVQAPTVASHEQNRARRARVITIRSAALANHAQLQAGIPKTVTIVDSAGFQPRRQQHGSHVVAPRPAALTNHAILSGGVPLTSHVVLAAQAPRQRHPSRIAQSRVIVVPAAPTTTPPKTVTAVLVAQAPRQRHLGAVNAPRPQGLIFTPAAPTATPPKTVIVITTGGGQRRSTRARIIAPRPIFAPVAAPRPVVVDQAAFSKRKQRLGLVIQRRVVTAPTPAVTPPKPVIVRAAPQRRTRLGAVLAPLRQRFAAGVGPAPTLITTPATGYVTVGDTAQSSVGGTGLISVGASGAQLVGDTGIPRQGYAPSDICVLGYSNQVLGGVIVGDVETLIGRQFHGLRQNQAYTTTGVAGAVNEYDAGRTTSYRAIQFDTLPGGWAAAATGAADTQLVAFCTAVTNAHRWTAQNPFLVCLHHEATLSPFGTAGFLAADYKAMWQHCVPVMLATGAPIAFALVGWDRMFVGANGVGPPTAGQGIDDLDPGSSFYTYIGSDVYNSIDSPGVLRYGLAASTLLDPIRAAAVARGKDWIIGEMGCEDGTTTTDHTNKAFWLDGLRTYIDGCGTTSPGVCRAMLTTIKADASNYNVDSSAESLAAWQRLGFDSYYA